MTKPDFTRRIPHSAIVAGGPEYARQQSIAMQDEGATWMQYDRENATGDILMSGWKVRPHD